MPAKRFILPLSATLAVAAAATAVYRRRKSAAHPPEHPATDTVSWQDRDMYRADHDAGGHDTSSWKEGDMYRPQQHHEHGSPA